VAPMAEHPGNPETGATLLCGRYRLEAHLASGGMGEVWRGTDVTLHRPVAVKLLHDHLSADPDLVERFRREARAAARLNHPGIVAVYDTCTDGGRQAIVLQLVDGPTLRTYLDRVGVLSDAQTVTLGVTVAEALAVAHDAGVIHRDVKPANILLGPERAMVTDFGVAKALDETDHTATGSLLGSVRYLAPEQVRSEAPDGRSDVFGLGVVLFECLSGTVPWEAATPAATALARLDTPPRPLPPEVSPALAAVVLRCLAVHPDDRFPDGRALAAALRNAGHQAAQHQPDRPTGPDPTVVNAGPPVSDLHTGVDAPDPDGDRSVDDEVPWDDEVAWDDGSAHGWDADEDAESWTGLGRRGCAGPVALGLLLVVAVAVIVALLGGLDLLNPPTPP